MFSRHCKQNDIKISNVKIKKKNDTEKIEKCFALVGNNNSWWHESDIVFPLARGVRD